MRKAQIFFAGTRAGRLVEDASGYLFAYDEAYLSSTEPVAISKTLPCRSEPYHSNVLFPFFDGLIPEGWLLTHVENVWKVNQRDRMGLLRIHPTKYTLRVRRLGVMRALLAQRSS